ncbi:hypothetical protein [Haloarcula sp. JP-L23]|uniref:hypothetical protein n=1 Tax=Haloarcula sp. JP-L23 TaxID=2716717 RepID=UPI00140F08AA|nr:hypothetical protein G9465_08140 [Haloarcula sp. JP-L23]
MSDDASFPDVPADHLREEGWELTDESVETVFKLPTASVVGATKLYDDVRTRAAAEAAAGVDYQWRFFFATALTFRPPLTPGIGPAMILPTVRSEANSTFADELRDRGFEDVERGRRERIRTDSGARARLRTYTASMPLPETDATLSITGWVGVWHGDGFRIAAGAYPDDAIGELLGVDDPPERLRRRPSEYRDDLLSLIRAVE